MRLKVTRAELREIAAGEVSASVRDRAKRMLDPVPAVIPGQTDLEEMARDNSDLWADSKGPRDRLYDRPPARN